MRKLLIGVLVLGTLNSYAQKNLGFDNEVNCTAALLSNSNELRSQYTDLGKNINEKECECRALDYHLNVAVNSKYEKALYWFKSIETNENKYSTISTENIIDELNLISDEERNEPFGYFNDGYNSGRNQMD